MLLFYACALFFAQKIPFVTSDLGRHITNGRLVCEEGTVIATNYYSYTEPDVPTVTHHWGSGVIFYLIWKSFGFEGLSLLYVLLLTLTLYLFFTVAGKSSNWLVAFFFTVLSLPLIAARTDIRPEGFSYLLAGVYLYILYHVKEERLPSPVLYVLPFLQLLWVNLHIYFPLGVALIVIFYIDNQRHKIRRSQYGFVLLAACFACVINPFRVVGMLAPLMIFNNYGYMVAENQSLFFMAQRFAYPRYLHAMIMMVIAVLSIMLIMRRKEGTHRLIRFFILVGLGGLAVAMVRCIPLFALFAVPCISGNYYNRFRITNGGEGVSAQRSMLVIALIILAAGLVVPGHYFSPRKPSAGIGLMPEVETSAEFMRTTNIQGPIFNNYDSGGYLIFHLFPTLRPFVDNRPEAYSVNFLRNVYVPMQQHDEVWQEVDREYAFNAIFFYRHDNTPWAQPFLLRRIKDPAWAPVYVDRYAIILLRRNDQNAAVIRHYELPQEMFRAIENK